MKTTLLLITLMWTFAPPTTTQSHEALDNAEKKILAALHKHKSYSGTITLKVDLSGTVLWDRGDGKGTVQYLIQGEKVLSRVDIIQDSISTVGPSEIKTHEEHTLYGDGKIVYDIGESNGQKMAFKMKADPVQSALPSKGFFEVLRKDFNSKLLPDEKIDGHDVWVIEARPNDSGRTPASRTVSYIRKDIAVIVKTVSYSKTNQPFQTTTITEIKVNPKLDPERFNFKLPPDYELVDLTIEGE